MQPPVPQRAAQDFVPGQVLASRELRASADLFTQFAALTGDRHPIHYDTSYAQAKGLRAPIAHGLLLVALSALGATRLSDELHEAMVAMVGVDSRFLSPVFLDDPIRLVFTVGEVVPGSRNRSRVRFDVLVCAPGPAPASEAQAYAWVRLHFLIATSLDGSPCIHP